MEHKMGFVKKYIEKGVTKLTLIDALSELRTQLKELQPIDEHNYCTVAMFNYAVDFFKIIASFQNKYNFDTKAFRYYSFGELTTDVSHSIDFLNHHELKHLKTRYKYDINDLQCQNRRDVLKKLAELINKYGYQSPETAPDTYEKWDKTNKTTAFYLIDKPGTEVSWHNVHYCGDRLEDRTIRCFGRGRGVIRNSLKNDIECARNQLLVFLGYVLDDLYLKPRNPIVLRAANEKGSR